jgi:hypothetical protein
VNSTAASTLERAADLVVASYRQRTPHETESAIAYLALWGLDAVEAGLIAPRDAARIFTTLEVEIGDMRDGPELSEDTGQLLLEAMLLHDWGTEFSADLDELRRLAFAILGAVAA